MGQTGAGGLYGRLPVRGYQEAEKPEERKVYTVGGWREPGWMDWKEFGEWVEAFGRMGHPAEKGERADEREMAEEVLRRTAVWAYHDGRGEENWMKAGVFGLAGMEAYAVDVADLTKGPDYWTPDWLGCHAINRQTSGRKCAGAYLERVATLFPAAAASHLRGAAVHYRAAHQAWEEFGRQLGRLNPEAAKDAKTVWSDPERRKAGAAVIRKAAEHERKAVGEVEEALVEMG